MSKIKIAIIGCGTIANDAHIPAYLANPKAEIIYFCDIIPERARAAVEKYGCGTAVTDYREVLRDPEVRAVSVCTPNNAHAEISIAALEAGKDVLCEKPAARTYAEAREMLAAKQRTGRILNIGMVNRFHSGVNEIRKLIEQGALGEIYHVYISFRAYRSIPGIGGDFTNSAVAGGGALIDWGVHFIDIVMYCLGDPAIRTVSAETFSKLGKNIADYKYLSMWSRGPKLDGVYDVDDSVTGLVRTENAVLTLHGAWAQNINQREMYIDFMGDKGGIRLNYGADFTLYTELYGMLSETKFHLRKSNFFQNEIDAFIEAVETRVENPAQIEKAILTSQIIQAMYDSAARHEEVKL